MAIYILSGHNFRFQKINRLENQIYETLPYFFKQIIDLSVPQKILFSNDVML